VCCGWWCVCLWPAAVRPMGCLCRCPCVWRDARPFLFM